MQSNSSKFITLDEVKGLLQPIQEKLREVEAQLRALTPTTANPTSAFTMNTASEPPLHVHIAPTPVTYHDAFERTGGKAALGECEHISHGVRDAVIDPKLAFELQELFPVACPKRGYSTVLVNQPFVSKFKELHAAALRALPYFETFVKRLAGATQGRALVAPLKNPERARAKSAFKYSDGTGVAWYRLTDLVRGTIAYSDISALYTGLRTVASECKVREFNDRYLRPMPGGYRDLQLVVEVSGHLCELQLNTELMLCAKETMGHRDYELVRELQAAVAAGDLKLCKQTLKWANDHLGSSQQQTVLQTKEGAALLHQACATGRVEIVMCLLEQKCCPNAQDEKGNTGLHLAMAGGHERTVWALVNKAGVDVLKTNARGQTALLVGYLSFRAYPEERRARALSTLAHFAGLHHVSQTRARVDEEVKKYQYNSSHLVDFAREGRIDKLAVELQNFADPNSVGRDQEIALVAAASNGHSNCVERLLKYKPSGKIQQQALVAAAQHQQWSSVELLADCQPDADTQEKVANQFVQTGDLAMLVKHSELWQNERLKRLTSSFLDTQSRKAQQFYLKTFEGQLAALKWAVEAGHFQVVEFLLFAGTPPATGLVEQCEELLTLSKDAGRLLQLFLREGLPRVTFSRVTKEVISLLIETFSNMPGGHCQPVPWVFTNPDYDINLQDDLILLATLLASPNCASFPLDLSFGFLTFPILSLRENTPFHFRWGGDKRYRQACAVFLGTLISKLNRTLVATFTFNTKRRISGISDLESVATCSLEND